MSDRDDTPSPSPTPTPDPGTNAPFTAKELDLLRKALLTRAGKKLKAGYEPFWEDEELMDILRAIRDQWAPRSAEYRRLHRIIRTLEREEGLTKSDIVSFVITAPAVEYPNGHSRFESLAWPVFLPTAETRHLFAAARALRGAGHQSSDFLLPLEERALALGGKANIIPAPVMFRNAAHKKSNPGHTPQMYGTAASLAKSSDALFNAGLFVLPPNRVGLTFEKWAEAAWHSVVVIVLHDVKGRLGLASPGKHYLIGDPNILSFHDKFSSITEILDKGTARMLRELNAKNVWVNLPRPVRNGDGLCLQLACEWLIELVEHGLGVHYDKAGKVESIDHFRPVCI
ncbi:hypothetical protein C8F01DRAFT_1247994 [Mycena amicta]|nr:hypothetical protein C8F01DRAFT_1247994 [Mycena amicta]